MVQQQYYSLGALAERDANQPFAKPAPPPPPPTAVPTDQVPTPTKAMYEAALLTKVVDLYAA